MAQGKRPDVDGLAALAAWSGIDVDDFVRSATLSTAELLIKRSFRDLRVLGEPLDPGGVDAVAVEQRLCGRQYPFSGVAAAGRHPGPVLIVHASQEHTDQYSNPKRLSPELFVGIPIGLPGLCRLSAHSHNWKAELMTKSTDLFLVTGATGNTGAHTVRVLCEKGLRVRAFVHTLDERAIRLSEQGAEVIHGDLLDFRAVSAAMSGVTAAYFTYPIRAGLVEATVNLAQAATEAGVRAVVNMSQISARREATSNAARQHWIAERLLDRTPMITTHLRPTFFMEWLSGFWVRRDDEGIYRLPLADARHAPIAAADQAEVIAAIMQDPEPHDRRIYPLFGAEELDWYAIATKVRDTLGIPVRYEALEIPVFATGLRAGGFPSHFVQHISNVAQDYRDGIFSGINDVVEVIGGTRPMTVEDYVATNRPKFETSGRLGITDERLRGATPNTDSRENIA
jgi:NAD(P)H dehydrogenase (quinone)